MSVCALLSPICLVIADKQTQHIFSLHLTSSIADWNHRLIWLSLASLLLLDVNIKWVLSCGTSSPPKLKISLFKTSPSDLFDLYPPYIVNSRFSLSMPKEGLCLYYIVPSYSCYCCLLYTQEQRQDLSLLDWKQHKSFDVEKPWMNAEQYRHS